MINNQNGVIRNFHSQADMEFAASLTKHEGWHSETILEIQSFFEHEPQGCFLYEQNGVCVGICIATAYHQIGFIGELIVDRKYRNLGIGKALMHQSIQFLQKNHLRGIFLDGVQKAIPLYESLGFKPICRSLRFFGQIPAKESTEVQPMSIEDLQEVFLLDQRTFGDDRSFFLQRRWQNYPDLALVWKQNHHISGYLFGRVGSGGWVTVGPWVRLNDQPADLTLLSHLQAKIGNQPFSIGILENRKSIIPQIVMAGMQPQSDPPTRMILGIGNNPGDNDQCCAIGSPAKG
ncbi:MAG: GNAT family N-acetyltransferase [Anaerolineaceae bacterium]|nr:GNAT family N-acetyltransferase [Anaerolineaceae bacterium]